MADQNGFRKALVFSLTFISYGLYHASRKTLSGVKKSMIDEWTNNGTHEFEFESGGNGIVDPIFPSKDDASNFLGLLDCLFMLAYAAALFFWGYMGDRYNPRNLITMGMIFSGVTLTAFGALPHFTHFYSIPFYMITYLGFGVFQACGWPNELVIMSNWFGESNRGLLMGIWSSCQSIGNIFGAMVISFTLPMGYEYSFVANSAFIFFGGILFYFLIDPAPKESRLRREVENVEENSSDDEDDVVRQPRQPIDNHAPITIWEALCLPNVAPYCLCNACLKFVNYAFFFWLPFYLSKNFGWDETEANQLSTWFDVGGIVGSIVGGLVSDRIGHRSPVVVTMLVTSLFSLLIYSGLGNDKLANSLVMTLLGFTIAGPYNLIVGTVSIDLGNQPELNGNPKAMSTVSGLLDGTGSFGSAIGQAVIPFVQNSRVGWSGVFYLFIIMNTLSIFCLARRFFRDVAHLKRSWKRRHERESEPLLSP
ncbi:hypothetical protein L596_011699 [Steinernema carpocapsae]|uniref:Major facilitator superfamily (MFS) profile domain-containing protein n=1 Tax=Steinernema carpocapsae TaxID=34508 RepID=A0A4U5NVI7_STECR|nr:hypothetical protein L596_011699 [Steinernema carpocapsae]